MQFKNISNYWWSCLITNQAVDIFFTPEWVSSEGRRVAGTALFPWKCRDSRYVFFLATDGNSRVDYDRATTLIHELAHCFGLFHTHEALFRSDHSNGNARGCYQEYVSRTNRLSFWAGCFQRAGRLRCSVNGDLLCGTDAAPGTNATGNIGGVVTSVFDGDLRSYHYMGLDANLNPLTDNNPLVGMYVGGGTDNDGVAWQENGNFVPNFMSANQRRFRWQFTRDQVTIMDLYLRNRVDKDFINIASLSPRSRFTKHMAPNPTEFYMNYSVDMYENDNFSENANRINIEDVQHHAFHINPQHSVQARILRLPPNIHPRDVYATFANNPPVANDVDWVWFNVTEHGRVIIKTSPVNYRPSPRTRVQLFTGAFDAGGTNNIRLAQPSNEIPLLDLNGDPDFVTAQVELQPGIYLVRVFNEINNPADPKAAGHYNLGVFECFDSYQRYNGPNAMCNLNDEYTFSLNAAPPLPMTTQYQWSVVGSSISISNGINTPELKVIAQQQGESRIRLEVRDPNCRNGQITTYEQRVWVGAPSDEGYEVISSNLRVKGPTGNGSIFVRIPEISFCDNASIEILTPGLSVSPLSTLQFEDPFVHGFRLTGDAPQCAIQTYSFRVAYANACDIAYSPTYSFEVDNAYDCRTEEKDYLNQIKVYPNPTDNNFFFSLDNPLGLSYTYTVRTLSGQTLLQKTSSAEVETVHTADWSPGIYLVEVIKSDGAVLRSKISIIK